MNRQLSPVVTTRVETLIHSVRGKRIILDADLASLYGVSTKRLNEQVKRNGERFPDDFMFRLTQQETAGIRSQIATAYESKRNVRFLPFAFTEHGALMAANVLNSPRAVEMSVFVVRAFMKMRDTFIQNKQITSLLVDLEKKLTARLLLVAGGRGLRKMEPCMERSRFIWETGAGSGQRG